MNATGRKKVIGLIGGIGSGKSMVAGLFASLGCAVIDSDELSHRVINQPRVRDELVKWWGPGVVGADGRVDRSAIGRIVFADESQLARLEGLLHPRVHEERARLREEYQCDPKVVAIVEDTPLLMEKGLEDQCDVLVFVETSKEKRLGRVAGRGWDEAEMARREKRQMPLDIKRQQADHVIDNNACEVDCLSQVRSVLSLILHEQGR